MKKPFLVLVVLVSTVFSSSPSYAEWMKVDDSVSGDTWYIDFERIRKHDGYVYWWDMSDYLKPDEYGDFSVKYYQQGDCKLFRVKRLSYSFHKEPMGGGSGEVIKPTGERRDWQYPSPASLSETILKEVCKH